MLLTYSYQITLFLLLCFIEVKTTLLNIAEYFISKCVFSVLKNVILCIPIHIYPYYKSSFSVSLSTEYTFYVQLYYTKYQSTPEKFHHYKQSNPSNSPWNSYIFINPHIIIFLYNLCVQNFLSSSNFVFNDPPPPPSL